MQSAKKASGSTDANDFSYIDTAVANFFKEWKKPPHLGFAPDLTIFIYCLHYLEVASNHITPLLSQILPAGLLRRADGEAKPGDDGAKPAIAEDVE